MEKCAIARVRHIMHKIMHREKIDNVKHGI